VQDTINNISQKGAVSYDSLTSIMNSEILERRKEVRRIIEFECWGFLNITFALCKLALMLKI